MVTGVPGSNPASSSVGLGSGRTVLGSSFGGIFAGGFTRRFLSRVTNTQRLQSAIHNHSTIAKDGQLANRI